MEEVLQEIELKHDYEGLGLFQVFYGDGHFIAKEIGGNREFTYSLDIPLEELTSNTEIKNEILSYCLSKITAEDELTIGDVFLHGKYTTLIK